MRVFHCDHFAVPLPSEHRFPMAKYARLRARLVELGVLDERELEAAEPAPIEKLVLAHDSSYVESFVSGSIEARAMARIGFPWSRELVLRSTASVGATLAATRAALEHGFSGTLAGGTHHAHRSEGSGFCVFNDIAVAAVDLLERRDVERILIVDLDVHQGDGTAAIFEHDERVFTFSMHGARNFPAKKERGDLDVALEDGIDDELYLPMLDLHLAEALERSQPEFVFYQGGVDPLREDRLGRLALSHAGLAERDARVFRAARELGVPLVATLGGGYAEPIELSIEAHVNTYRAARIVFG